MALKYTITHNGSTWNSSTDVDAVSLSNGSVTSLITAAETRTLNCAGKYMPNNLVIGSKTLNCVGNIMSGDVVISVENSGTFPVFVCVGTSGSSYYSTNGTTWTAMSGLDSSYGYYGVTYGNDRFVCVGSSGLSYYSTDGLTWTAMSGLDSSYGYHGVTYGNDRFVCVGEYGLSYYSTDGETWTAMSGT